jgi:hypothetical protein
MHTSPSLAFGDRPASSGVVFSLPEKRIISRKGCKNQLTITADNDKILT